MLALLGLGLLQATSPLAIVDDSIRIDHDVLHYHIALTVPDTGSTVYAATQIRYRIVGGDGPLDLDFDRALSIDSVRTDDGQRSRNVSWRWNDGGVEDHLLVSHWGALLDTLSVTIYYHGRPRDGLVVQDNVHGERTVFADNWPNRARHWFPAEDHPSDKATVSFAVEVPAGWRVVANGRLERRAGRVDNREIWFWREDRPIPVHTMVVGAGRMAVTDLGEAAGVPQSVWTFPSDSAFAVNGPFRRAKQMVQVLSDLVGPFPYAKLAHVQSSTRFGGMENSSAIFYNERGYANRRMGEGVVAHEIAHQWFGDAVTQFDWHHLWLSEGFASYFGPLFYERVGEDSTFRARMLASKHAYMNSAAVSYPVIDPTVQGLLGLLNANNYSKGAWILHMLRGEVGDSAFFGGIREYYERYRDSTTLTSDLVAVMSRRAGRSLDWFFHQWLLRPGYPQLVVDWQHGVEDRRVVLELQQVQPEAWGIFRLRVPVRLELPQGLVRQAVAEVVDGETHLAIEGIGSPPTRILIDPEATILAAVRLLER